MNHIYRIVFNRKLGVFQAVSECAHAMGKSGCSAVRRGVAHPLTSAFALAAMLTATGIAMPNLAEAAFITTGGGVGGGISAVGGSEVVAGGAGSGGGRCGSPCVRPCGVFFSRRTRWDCRRWKGRLGAWWRRGNSGLVEASSRMHCWPR